jgi:hypothetical protein
MHQGPLSPAVALRSTRSLCRGGPGAGGAPRARLGHTPSSLAPPRRPEAPGAPAETPAVHASAGRSVTAPHQSGHSTSVERSLGNSCLECRPLHRCWVREGRGRGAVAATGERPCRAQLPQAAASAPAVEIRAPQGGCGRLVARWLEARAELGVARSNHHAMRSPRVVRPGRWWRRRMIGCEQSAEHRVGVGLAATHDEPQRHERCRDRRCLRSPAATAAPPFSLSPCPHWADILVAPPRRYHQRRPVSPAH